MKIEYDFDYAACSEDIADEFCANDSEYQAEVLNIIGQQFKIWSQDKKRTSTYIQILEIAEQLSDNGRWFIKTLCEYIDDKAERSERE
jgi:hypothetical protein